MDFEFSMGRIYLLSLTLCKQKECLSFIEPLCLSLFTQLNKGRITTLIIAELNDGLNDELCTNQLFKLSFRQCC